MVEGEETGGEEDEGESRPGQPQVEIRRDKWETRREMSHKTNDRSEGLFDEYIFVVL